MAGLPLRYTFRNLLRRKTRTALTLAGVGLVIGAVVFMLAFSRSMAATMRHTGDPDNLIIISKKAQTYVLSSISEQNTDLLELELWDYAKTYVNEEGLEEPMISPEVFIGLDIEVKDAESFREGKKRGIVHGVEPTVGPLVNSRVRLVEGRWPRKDKMEIAVGSTAFARLGIKEEDLRIGTKVKMLGRFARWTVVGRFEAPGTLFDSELWVPRDILKVNLKRRDTSFIRVKVEDPSKIPEICKRLSTDEQYEVKAFPEQAYFADYAEGFDIFQRFAQVMAMIIIAGGMVAGMNTMYTSVMGRIREIGTLQVIGFSKRSVLAAILTESLLIALLSGVIGCLIGVLANGIPMTMPMCAFKVKVDMVVVGWAMVATLIIGLGGAYVPAHRALKLRMVDAVRSQ